MQYSTYAKLIISIKRKEQEVTFQQNELMDLPENFPVEHIIACFSDQETQRSILLTTKGCFSHPYLSHRLLLRLTNRHRYRCFSYAMNQLGEKKGIYLKPIFNVNYCFQPLSRFRDAPDFLNLCFLNDFELQKEYVHVKLEEYWFTLLVSKESFLKVLHRAASFFTSYVRFELNGYKKIFPLTKEEVMYRPTFLEKEQHQAFCIFNWEECLKEATKKTIAYDLKRKYFVL